MKDVQQTSISAYNEGVRDGTIPSQRRRIYNLLANKGSMTNRMIGKVLNIELGSVSARVNAMLKSGLLTKSHYGQCPCSGSRVRWVQIAGPKQMEMEL